MKILFTGGGTGGHLFPIIAIIRELKNFTPKEVSPEFYFIGPKTEVGIDLLKNEGVLIKTILAGKVRRYFTAKDLLQNIVDILFKIPIGIIQSFRYLRIIRPNIVFGKGGYGALPVIWASRCLKIPIFLHESDAVPGQVTKIFAKSAVKIFTSFKEMETDNLPVSKIFYTGNPVRKEILNGDRASAREIFKLIDDKPTILILGGSQGAERINNLILNMLPQLLKNFEIIHQCGEKMIKEIWFTAKVIAKKDDLFKYYHTVSFLDEKALKHAFSASHLIISRAGSGAISEIAAVGKPSILLPLPEASQNHQMKNAKIYLKSGATVLLIESKKPSSALLFSKLMSIFSVSGKLDEMGRDALAFSEPDAAKTIAIYLAEYLNPSKP